MATRYHLQVRHYFTILFVAAALLISGCGSSSPTRSAASTSGQSASSEAVAHKTPRVNRDVVTRGVVTHRPMAGTGGGEINDDNPGSADSGRGKVTGQNPCTFVSKAQAQAIVGRPIDALVEAPLGPTCIYQSPGAKSAITLTVESIDLTKIQPHIRNRRRVKVEGRTAWCGDYGQPMTLVPLAGRRVLDITAPCAIGIRFAVIAMPRLKL